MVRKIVYVKQGDLYAAESRVRENHTHGSEGGETGYTTGLSYPYREIWTSLLDLK